MTFMGGVATIAIAIAAAEGGGATLRADRGEAIGKTFMRTLQHGFEADDFSAQYLLFADDVSWDWSGGESGSGTRQDFFDTLARTWQPLLSSFDPTNVMYVTDTARGIVSIPHELVINVDGRGNGPTCLFRGKNVFEIHLNTDHKITAFNGVWDPNDPALNACIGSASGPDLVSICRNAYLNYQTGGEDGLPLDEYWTSDAVLRPMFPVPGWTEQVGRANILDQIRNLDDYPALEGFSVTPYAFERLGNKVYAYEHVTTSAGASFDGLAVHTFNGGGECVRTETYHDSAELVS
jgi:hypothetical protein